MIRDEIQQSIYEKLRKIALSSGSVRLSPKMKVLLEEKTEKMISDFENQAIDKYKKHSNKWHPS